MVGLVAVAILTDKDRKVIRLHAAPRNRKQLIHFLLKRLFARIQPNQPLRVMRCKERRLPRVGLAVHVFIIRVRRVKVLDPLTVGQFAPHQARCGIEHILIVAGAFHQHLVIGRIAQFLGQQRHRIIIIRIFERLGHARGGLGLDIRVFNIRLGDIPLFHVFGDMRPSPAFHRGIPQQQVIRALDIVPAYLA